MEALTKMTHKMKITTIYEKLNSNVRGKSIKLRDCKDYIIFVESLSDEVSRKIWGVEYKIERGNLLVLLKENKRRILKWMKEKKKEGRFTEMSRRNTDIRSYFVPVRRM